MTDESRKGAAKKFYPVAEPVFSGNELRYVADAVRSGWVSSIGRYVAIFEQSFARYCGVRHAISCMNGTAAMHLALLSVGIKEGDEVLLPSLTFIATANAVRYTGAAPRFVDVDPVYWQIDPALLERAITKKTRAIIAVHLYGHPAPMPEIMRIARRHNLLVIEDAAEAVGAEINGEKVGTWGDTAAFSFYGNKIITTGDGGMVVTNSKTMEDRARLYRGQGMSGRVRYQHEVVGYNYRMTNVQAALGCAQLERIQPILKKKIAVGRWYRRYLRGIPGITYTDEASWAKNVYWMASILVEPRRAGMDRDELARKLLQRGIETRPFFIPVHKQPSYRAYWHVKLPVTEAIAGRGLNLPSSSKLREADIEHIARTIRSIIGR